MESRKGLPFAEWMRNQTAASNERDRVLEIEAFASPGREPLIAQCIADPKCTPQIAALRILRYEKSAPAIVRRILAAHQAAQGRQ
jgi:hypothetical protein